MVKSEDPVIHLVTAPVYNNMQRDGQMDGQNIAITLQH